MTGHVIRLPESHGWKSSRNRSLAIGAGIVLFGVLATLSLLAVVSATTPATHNPGPTGETLGTQGMGTLDGVSVLVSTSDTTHPAASAQPYAVGSTTSLTIASVQPYAADLTPSIAITSAQPYAADLTPSLAIASAQPYAVGSESLAAASRTAMVADDDDDPPAVPASYYGSVTVDGDPAPVGTVVSASVDGEVRASIEVEVAGEYGDPRFGEEKLEVPGEPGDGEVTFLVNGEVVDTDPDEVIWEENDLKEVDLFGSDIDTDPHLSVTVDESASDTSVAVGDTATVVASIENTGYSVADDVVTFSVDGAETDSVGVTLDVDESTTVSFALQRDVETTVQVLVSSPHDDDGISVAFEDESTDDSTDEGGITDEPEEPSGPVPVVSAPSGVSVIAESTVELSIDETAPLAMAVFDGTSVEELTIQTADVDEYATARDLDRVPPAAPRPPGTVLLVTQLAVSAEAVDATGTFTAAIPQATMAAVGATQDDVWTFQLDDGEWVPVPVDVTDGTGEHVTATAETSGFGLFVISAVSEPAAVATATPTGVDFGDVVEFDGSQSTDEFGTIERYEWDVAGETLQGETVTTAIEASGTIDVQLTVENAAGVTSTDTVRVEVGERRFHLTLIAVDETGTGLESVDVRIGNQVQTTDDDGTVTFILPAGEYEVTVEDGDAEVAEKTISFDDDAIRVVSSAGFDAGTEPSEDGDDTPETVDDSDVGVDDSTDGVESAGHVGDQPDGESDEPVFGFLAGLLVGILGAVIFGAAIYVRNRRPRSSDSGG